MMGLLYQTYVEVEDGHSRNWGFSPSDEYANIFGSGFFLAQHYLPFLQNFLPRWQYVPARWSGAASRSNGGTFIDDYNSSTFWYAVNVRNLLPGEFRRFWPRWLMLGAGYGVRGIDVPGQQPVRYAMIALDYDMLELLPEGPGVWNWVRQTLNHIKFPSPAQEFGPTTRFYLMYPFRLSPGKVHF
jgi:hypothetical protein